MGETVKSAAHVEIGLYQWQLAHRDVHCRIYWRLLALGPFIVENGHAVEVAEIGSYNRTLADRADPYSRQHGLKRVDGTHIQ
jgi:hypothetical protein